MISPTNVLTVLQGDGKVVWRRCSKSIDEAEPVHRRTGRTPSDAHVRNITSRISDSLGGMSPPDPASSSRRSKRRSIRELTGARRVPAEAKYGPAPMTA